MDEENMRKSSATVAAAFDGECTMHTYTSTLRSHHTTQMLYRQDATVMTHLLLRRALPSTSRSSSRSGLLTSPIASTVLKCLTMTSVMWYSAASASPSPPPLFQSPLVTVEQVRNEQGRGVEQGYEAEEGKRAPARATTRPFSGIHQHIYTFTNLSFSRLYGFHFTFLDFSYRCVRPSLPAAAAVAVAATLGTGASSSSTLPGIWTRHAMPRKSF